MSKIASLQQTAEFRALADAELDNVSGGALLLYGAAAGALAAVLWEKTTVLDAAPSVDDAKAWLAGK